MRDALTRLWPAVTRFLRTHHLALAVAAFAIAAAGTLYTAGQRAERAAWQAKALTAKRDTVVREIRVVETRYRTDTLRFVRWRTRWDTVARDVERWKHDTLRVVEYVAVADSTIRACTAALTSCDRLRQLQQARAELAEQQLAIGQRGHRRRQLVTGIVAAAAGVAIGARLR